MENTTEMYFEESSPANELKGFTKSFQKRTKDKKEENKEVVEMLSYAKKGNLIIGAKVTEKAFKQGKVKKVFAASNCDELTLKKIQHYAKLLGVEVSVLELDNEELAVKLQKPFLISMVSVVEE
jgi:ribosomal protein L30E